MPDDPLDEIASAMTASLSHVRTAEITRATRSVDLDGVSVRQGQWIGLIDDVLVSAGDEIPSLARELLEKADADNYERITLYYGDETDETQANMLADSLKERFTEQEFEVVSGGQALYPYIISVE
jgi:dihydroxyacetone kinase-like predicted kinase